MAKTKSQNVIVLLLLLLQTLVRSVGSIDAAPLALEGDDVQVQDVEEAKDGSCWLVGHNTGELRVAGRVVEQSLRVESYAFVVVLSQSGEYKSSITIDGGTSSNGAASASFVSLDHEREVAYVMGQLEVSDANALAVRHNGNLIDEVPSQSDARNPQFDVFVLQLAFDSSNAPSRSNGVFPVRIDGSDTPAIAQIGGVSRELALGLLAPNKHTDDLWVALQFQSSSILNGTLQRVSGTASFEAALLRMRPNTFNLLDSLQFWSVKSESSFSAIGISRKFNCLTSSPTHVHFMLHIQFLSSVCGGNRRNDIAETSCPLNISTPRADEQVSTAIVNVQHQNMSVQVATLLHASAADGDPRFAQGSSLTYAEGVESLVLTGKFERTLKLYTLVPGEQPQEDRVIEPSSDLTAGFVVRLDAAGTAVETNSFSVINGSGLMIPTAIGAANGAQSQLWLYGSYDSPGVDFGNGVRLLHPLLENVETIGATGFLLKLEQQSLQPQTVLSIGGDEVEHLSGLTVGNSQTWISGWSTSLSLTFGDAVPVLEKDQSGSSLSFVAALSCGNGGWRFYLEYSSESAQRVTVELFEAACDEADRSDAVTPPGGVSLAPGEVQSQCIMNAGTYCVRLAKGSKQTVSPRSKVAF